MAEPVAANSTGPAATVTVEVAHARPDKQVLRPLTVAAGSTVAEVLAQAALEHDFPDLDWRQQAVGIWSRPVSPETVVQAGDRIEVYRPLQLDPSTTLRQKEKARRRERGLPDSKK